MKKLSILFLALFMSLFSLTSAAYAEDDITGTPFEEDLRSLIEKGIMSGYEDGTYRPTKSVTRAEFTVFLNGALEVDPEEGDYPDQQFTDVKPGQWYYESVMSAYNQGLVNGYPDETFRPGEVISRQEMAVMMINAADSKNVVTKRKPLAFEDNEDISPYAEESVERLTYLEIISGKQTSDGKLFFAPKDETSRGETAAVINRLIKVLNPPEELDYSVATLGDEEKIVHGEYETYEEAVESAEGDQVVLKGNNIVWISEGKAVSNGVAYVYTNKDFTSTSTYFDAGVAVELLDIGEDWVKVKIADTKGYIEKKRMNLVPNNMIKDYSYYYVQDGNLRHRIYNSLTEKAVGYTYGKAPSFMKEGIKYTSPNGNEFYDESGRLAGGKYQYFNRMPLYTETSYTAEQLDEYIKYESPDSPLIGTGAAFKKAEAEYGTNALYLLAHAIHESDWGTSRIAVDKNNLFGIGAYDTNPYENAWEYESYEEGILEAASEFIVPGYFEDTWKGNGAHLGNKSSGMNIRYASDPYWGQKISGHMYNMDRFLSESYTTKPENGAYELAKTVTPNVNIRSNPRVESDNLIYQLKKIGSTVQILDVMEGAGTWYEITPKNIKVMEEETESEKDREKSRAFVYSHGSSIYGTSLEKLPVAK